MLRLASYSVFFLAGATLHAGVTVTLKATTTLTSPQVVGAVIGIQAKGTTTGTGPVTYKYELLAPGSTSYAVLSDYNLATQFNWAANATDGTYFIRVTARDFLAGVTSAPYVKRFVINPLVTGSVPVVRATANPLVALFSAPGCAAGSFLRVKFTPQSGGTSSFTDFRPCLASSMNFLIGGLEAQSAYNLNFEVQTGSTITDDPNVLTFTTGPIPSGTALPVTQAIVPAGSATSQAEQINLLSDGAYKPAGTHCLSATDLQANTIWYNCAAVDQLTRPVVGGTLLQMVPGLGTGTGPWGYDNASNPKYQPKQQILQEVDLAGNVLRQTCADRISEQLPAGDLPYGIDRFSHEARKLPNGNYLVLADTQNVFPAGTAGSSGPIDIIGAVILILDPNFQVLWYWNSFDHAGGGTQLDLNRLPVVNPPYCQPSANNSSPGCPPAVLPGFTEALDWLHGNALQMLPDGNILASLRNQSWIVKINYANGTGDGSILWRMGLDGDFTFTGSSDPYPWFSGQHDPEFLNGGLTEMSVFDDGNARTAKYGGDSRGQVLNVDETAMTVSFVLNAELGSRSNVFGSAQPLANGDWFFCNGDIAPADKGGQTIEVNGQGTITFNESTTYPTYRAFRLVDFYNVQSLQ